MNDLGIWIFRLIVLVVFALACFGLAKTINPCLMGNIVTGILFVFLGVIVGVGYPRLEKKLIMKSVNKT